ncbi:helix-turn-helix transcriptional regulator [Sinimarinibacterium sp. CAU 1509]|uniref:helix-turn-helix domain-containing protein n=1 Tax=Sinimarinibacterium sp. CAU 1509 TaxID=2562283 RepID=UPI0010AC04E9|nr:AraC family transcriptional regulator [Sinimarinibacterium sp. CAU 1509]TJY58395.1 helix-turn-helix transcriptional regulator [Sinimarinibacterium sp. CAU 1509]
MEYWLSVRKDLRVSPVVEGLIQGDSPIYVERYFFKSVDRSVKGLGGCGLVIDLDGARVREGETGQWRAEFIPGQSALVPPRCQTHWHYSGPVDFVVIYFPVQAAGVLEGLRRLAQAKCQPITFADPVVTAVARTLSDELNKGLGAEEHFLQLLAATMLQQTYRVLTAPAVRLLGPRHLHFERINRVLKLIRDHLGERLSLEQLASEAGISAPHFRRIFREAMGIPVHRFVLMARIEQARKLLATTQMPISRIADECGFSSQSHLTDSFRSAHAATPSEFRAMHR